MLTWKASLLQYFVTKGTGLLPLGTNEWKQYSGGSWGEAEMTVAAEQEPTPGAEETRAVLAREESEPEPAEQARRARVQLGIEGEPEPGASPAVVVIKGMPKDECNGRYLMKGVHDGWPHFENTRRGEGYKLYRFQGTCSWRTGPTFSPEDDSCSAYAVCKTGELPVGDSQRWQCYRGGSRWEPHTPTITLESGDARVGEFKSRGASLSQVLAEQPLARAGSDGK